jgi:hypothetical protein
LNKKLIEELRQKSVLIKELKKGGNEAALRQQLRLMTEKKDAYKAQNRLLRLEIERLNQ